MGITKTVPVLERNQVCVGGSVGETGVLINEANSTTLQIINLISGHVLALIALLNMICPRESRGAAHRRTDPQFGGDLDAPKFH